MFQKAGHINNKVAFIFQHIYCLKMMFSEVACASLATNNTWYRLSYRLSFLFLWLCSHVIFSGFRLFIFTSSNLTQQIWISAFWHLGLLWKKNTCKFLKHVDVKTNPRQLGQRWNSTDIKGACIFLNLAASSMLSVNIHSNEILILFPQNPKLEVPELTALFKGKELGIQIRFLQSETWKNQYQSPSLESLEFFQVVLLQN